ncbi:MAG: hypothetical protein ACOY37_03660 [Pseudomonadota bacterium]
MHRPSFPSRAVLAALVLAAAATSGCSWFRRGNALYAGPAESRPLEVPPELDTATTAASTSAGSVTASGAQQAAAAAQAALGFTVAGERDAVYNRVGEVLGAMEGLTIASRAQLLGAYDVNYAGASFLVRVSPGTGGVYVSAVDPRGLPATGDAPKRVIDALRAALAR